MTGLQCTPFAGYRIYRPEPACFKKKCPEPAPCMGSMREISIPGKKIGYITTVIQLPFHVYRVNKTG